MYAGLNTAFIKELDTTIKNVSLTHLIFTLIISYIFFLSFFIYLVRKILRIRKELKKVNKKLELHSFVDALTGVYNYRYFIKRFKESISYAQRENMCISLLKLDIHLFKNINAIYGTVFGNVVLREFADFLKSVTRNFDIVTHLEDDEFGVLLNFTDKEEALMLAKRIQEGLRFKNFGTKDKKIDIDVNIAVVTFPQDGFSEIDLLSLLDKCLDSSKENGKKILTPQQLAKEEEREIDTIYTADDLKNRIYKLESALGKTIIESIIAFAHAIRAKDLYTAEHAAKTVRISLSLGKKLKLDKHNLDTIRYAALLHDLGKVGIPEKILLKPARLTPEEFEEIKKHPLIGAEILRPLHELTHIIPPILYHHERIDGQGYPYGLIGNNIPLEAKIVAIADTFQSLISDRTYRKAYSVDEAIRIMEKEAGTHFDKYLIEIFKEVITDNGWRK